MKKLFLKLLLLFVVLAGSGQPLLSMDGAGPSRKRRRTMAAPLRSLAEIQADLANPQILSIFRSAAESGAAQELIGDIEFQEFLIDFDEELLRLLFVFSDYVKDEGVPSAFASLLSILRGEGVPVAFVGIAKKYPWLVEHVAHYATGDGSIGDAMVDAEDELEGEGEVAEREYGLVNPYYYDKNKPCFVDMFKRPVRLSGEGEQTECPEISMHSDVVLKILGYLSQKDRINTNLVCRSFDRNVRRFYQGNSNSREPLAIDRSKFTQEYIDWFSKHCFSRLKLLHGTKKDSFQLEQFEHLSIAELTGLKSLSVDFRDCRRISDAGLEAFARWLAGLTGLQSLSVNFVACEISYAGFEAFARLLGGLPGLKSLSVYFSGLKISDEGLEVFDRWLAGLTGLQSLSVCFSGCREISDGGFEAFFRLLGGLTRLKSLSVDFWGCEIGDAGFKIFCRLLDEQGFKPIGTTTNRTSCSWMRP